MLRIAGMPGAADVPLDVRFRDSETWVAPEMLAGLGAARPLDVTLVLFGDETAGPLVSFVAMRPGAELPAAPAHGHASDTWRMPLLGSLAMGRTEYSPGDFRFQRGWRPYPSDNFAVGPDGGWTVILFGDRRGTRIRRAGGEEAPEAERFERALAEWGGIGGDQVDLDDTCPASEMRTSVGDGARSGRVDGSFRDSARWPEEPSGTRRLAGLVGDATAGPVVVLSEAPAGAVVAPAGTMRSDAVRMVLRGSCSIGGAVLSPGDVRLQPAGRVQDVVAGPSGLSEVVILADRRTVAGDHDGWASCHRDLLEAIA